MLKQIKFSYYRSYCRRHFLLYGTGKSLYAAFRQFFSEKKTDFFYRTPQT